MALTAVTEVAVVPQAMATAVVLATEAEEATAALLLAMGGLSTARLFVSASTA